MKTKMSFKLVLLFYIGVALCTYLTTIKINNLESKDDVNYQNESIVLRLQ